MRLARGGECTSVQLTAPLRRGLAPRGPRVFDADCNEIALHEGSSLQADRVANAARTSRASESRWPHTATADATRIAERSPRNLTRGRPLFWRWVKCQGKRVGGRHVVSPSCRRRVELHGLALLLPRTLRDDSPSVKAAIGPAKSASKAVETRRVCGAGKWALIDCDRQEQRDQVERRRAPISADEYYCHSRYGHPTFFLIRSSRGSIDSFAVLTSMGHR